MAAGRSSASLIRDFPIQPTATAQALSAKEDVWGGQRLKYCSRKDCREDCIGSGAESNIYEGRLRVQGDQWVVMRGGGRTNISFV